MNILNKVLSQLFKDKIPTPEDHKVTPQYLIEYNDLLQRPEWKAKKKQILKRDGYKCRHCHQSKPLDVHHRYYWKDPSGSKIAPWMYENKSLISLCRECHQKEHEQHPTKTYFISWKDLNTLSQKYAASKE